MRSMINGTDQKNHLIQQLSFCHNSVWGWVGVESIMKNNNNNTTGILPASAKNMRKGRKSEVHSKNYINGRFGHYVTDRLVSWCWNRYGSGISFIREALGVRCRSTILSASLILVNAVKQSQMNLQCKTCAALPSCILGGLWGDT